MKAKKLFPAKTATVSGGSPSEIIESLEAALTYLGLSIVAHPSFEGSSDYGFIISDRRLTKDEIEDIQSEDEGSGQ